MESLVIGAYITDIVLIYFVVKIFGKLEDIYDELRRRK